MLACNALAADDDGWRELEPGLELGRFAASRPADVGDALVHVVRVDPASWTLRLLNASADEDDEPRTPRDWARKHGLAAVINASMYQEDLATSVSLMQTREHTNQARLSKDKTVLAFDRLDDDVPAVQIIDRTCQDFDSLRNRYGTLVQSIRMISCRGENVWAPQKKAWSTAAIGIDHDGRVLFIHSQSPYSTHELIDMLLALPLDLKNAMYVEGGPQAQLYVRSGTVELEMVGVYETGFIGSAVAQAWPIPNVIGVARRSAATAEAGRTP